MTIKKSTHRLLADQSITIETSCCKILIIHPKMYGIKIFPCILLRDSCFSTWQCSLWYFALKQVLHGSEDWHFLKLNRLNFYAKNLDKMEQLGSAARKIKFVLKILRKINIKLFIVILSTLTIGWSNLAFYAHHHMKSDF